MINLVSEQITSTILFHKNALDAWNDLHERFSKTYRVRILTLRFSINNLKPNSKSVMEYFLELKRVMGGT